MWFINNERLYIIMSHNTVESDKLSKFSVLFDLRNTHP